MEWFHKATAEKKETPLQHMPEPTTDNRASCYQHLAQVLSSSAKANKGVVMKLYLENFKNLNNMFGHDYCEKLLAQMIAFLKEKTGVSIYQYIGVEFIIILEHYTQGQATALTEEILEQFDCAWRIDETDCFCSTHIGLCSYAERTFTPDEMLRCLDLAVSKATEHGANQHVMYDSSLHTQFVRRQTIAVYLKTAIENREIEVRYRPTYQVATGRFSRAEYYMNVFIKGLGLITSAELLPIAEDSGQIRAIEYFALEQVCICISKLIASGKHFDSIALPISSVLFLQEDFLDTISDMMQNYSIPKGKLALEIQDSVLSETYLNVNITLQELSNMGVELILNNFGSGYFSIASILDLPINTLKLERMFIWQLETNPNSAHVINGLIQIASHLNLHIIAEGVETQHQNDTLTDYGCEYLQGFYYSPTLDAKTILKVIDTTPEESKASLA